MLDRPIPSSAPNPASPEPGACHEPGSAGVSPATRRRRGHRYLTLVYPIDRHRKRLLWIGRKRKAETLHGFFDGLGAARSAALRFVCSDMWKPYLKVVAERAGQAVHVLDRFHIMSHFSKAIDEVRAVEARKLAAEGKAPVLKRSRWLVLKRPENLTDAQSERLAERVRCNLHTVRAHLLKEDFQVLWEDVSPYWAGRFRPSSPRKRGPVVYPHDAFAARPDEEGRAHGGLPPGVDPELVPRPGALSNGIVEGFDGKARVTTRKAFGHRTCEALEVTLHHTLGDLPEPELTHGFC